MNTNTICAVVVTYNRKELLKKCLEALLCQTYQLDKILVIDNHSTDGTRKMLEQEFSSTIVEPVFLEMNTGGAGGFFYGLKKGYELGYDWLWILDDDTIPKSDCCEQIFIAKDQINDREKLSFLASSIYGPKGEFMNVPIIDNSPSVNGYPGWYRYLDNKMVRIKAATFVSIFINRSAISKCGFPCKEFFIWGDDSEYTMRLTQYYGSAYMVGGSQAVHLRTDTRVLSIDNENNLNRIKMFHYFFRNTFIYRRYYNDTVSQRLKNVKVVLNGLKLLRGKNGYIKFYEILKGYLESICDYKKFKNLIDRQIRDV